MARGKYIVVEGFEGAGKSTAMAVLEAFLKEKNIVYSVAREPGSSDFAEDLRAALKAPRDYLVSPLAELLTFYAARADTYRDVQKILDDGVWVISDRSAISTHAYQGIGSGMEKEVLMLREMLFGNTCPYDLAICLDIDPVVGIARAAKRGELDRIEKEIMNKAERIAGYYREAEHILANYADNIAMVDANQSVSDVAADIHAFLEQYYQDTIQTSKEGAHGENQETH